MIKQSYAKGTLDGFAIFFPPNFANVPRGDEGEGLTNGELSITQLFAGGGEGAKGGSELLPV